MEHDFVIITDDNDILDDSADQLHQRFISKILSTGAGKSALAQSMIAPLRRNIDYQSIGRKIFLIEEMPQGAQPYFENSLFGEDE